MSRSCSSLERNRLKNVKPAGGEDSSVGNVSEASEDSEDSVRDKDI